MTAPEPLPLDPRAVEAAVEALRDVACHCGAEYSDCANCGAEAAVAAAAPILLAAARQALADLAADLREATDYIPDDKHARDFVTGYVTATADVLAIIDRHAPEGDA